MTKKERLWSARLEEWKKNGLNQRRYAQSEREKELLREELARERSRFFGRSTEKLSDAERTQGRLFDEAEQAA